MNPQPEPYVGNVVALIIFGMFIYYFLKAYHSQEPSQKIGDLFTIGYIEESTPTININNTVQAIDAETQPLYNDCIEALHAIGMKKSEAKKKARQIFLTSNPKPTTIQEFLMLALKK